MIKKFLLLTTIILNSSLYSQATTGNVTGTMTLRNGKVYPNAKIFYINKDVIAELECGKKIVSKRSESQVVINDLTPWKTQEECEQAEEEARQAAEKRKEEKRLKEEQRQQELALKKQAEEKRKQEEVRRKEEKKLQEEQRRQELALKKQECEAKGDLWNGKDCRKKSVMPVIPTGGSGTIALNDGTVYQNAKFVYKGNTVIADFECGKQISFKQKEISKVQKGTINWKTKDECNPKKEEDTVKWSEYQGNTNWEDAKKQCTNIGMRLPTIDELKTAYAAKITKSWGKNGYGYWSSTSVDDYRAYLLDNFNGDSRVHTHLYSDGHVRCIRNSKEPEIIKKETKLTSDSDKWSEYRGKMNWEDAKAECKGPWYARRGMRLPTLEELKEAYKMNITDKWDRKGSDCYWSSKPDSGNTSIPFFSVYHAWYFKINSGNMHSTSSGLPHYENRHICHVRCIQAKEANTNLVKWSDYQGKMNWENAKKKCENIGMRLPTIEELKTAFSTKMTESWENDGNLYFSSTLDGVAHAYILHVNSGNSYSGFRSSDFYVRCIR
ncbi:MAG TPA: hypothetical protein PLG41_20405 [Leptospiraceae bacterium]|nr:hypothetical protein [Leptospiraceae bacterium]